MIEIDSERQLSSEKPGLDERGQVILPLRAQLHAQPEFLAAPSESGWMEQIEIALIDLGESDDRIHRAESSAHGQIAGALFVHANDEVLVAGDRRLSRFRPGIHFLKIG